MGGGVHRGIVPASLAAERPPIDEVMTRCRPARTRGRLTRRGRGSKRALRLDQGSGNQADYREAAHRRTREGSDR